MTRAPCVAAPLQRAAAERAAAAQVAATGADGMFTDVDGDPSPHFYFDAVRAPYGRV